MSSKRLFKAKGMVCAVGILVFRLHGCRSLKEKRSLINPLINRLRNDFKIAVAEVSANDLYQRAEIGFSLVSNETAHANSMVDKIIDRADSFVSLELIDSDFEIFHYSDF